MVARGQGLSLLCEAAYLAEAWGGVCISSSCGLLKSLCSHGACGRRGLRDDKEGGSLGSGSDTALWPP